MGPSQSRSTKMTKILSKIKNKTHKHYIKCILESFNLEKLENLSHYLKHITYTPMVSWLCTFVTFLLWREFSTKLFQKVLLQYYFSDKLIIVYWSWINSQVYIEWLIGNDIRSIFIFFPHLVLAIHYHFNSDKFFPFTCSLQITWELPNTMAKIQDHASCKRLMLLPIIGTTPCLVHWHLSL